MIKHKDFNSPGTLTTGSQNGALQGKNVISIETLPDGKIRVWHWE